MNKSKNIKKQLKNSIIEVQLKKYQILRIVNHFLVEKNTKNKKFLINSILSLNISTKKYKIQNIQGKKYIECLDVTSKEIDSPFIKRKNLFFKSNLNWRSFKFIYQEIFKRLNITIISIIKLFVLVKTNNNN